MLKPEGLIFIKKLYDQPSLNTRDHILSIRVKLVNICIQNPQALAKEAEQALWKEAVQGPLMGHPLINKVSVTVLRQLS